METANVRTAQPGRAVASARAPRLLDQYHVRHPAEMAEPEINTFLTHLAVKEKVSASTQNQFLYRQGHRSRGRRLGRGHPRAQAPARLPVVMTREEVKAVLANVASDKRIMASLIYGAGLRLTECLRLRVQDLDFARSEILVRDGKGAKDRMTMLPESLKAPLGDHLKKVRAIHEKRRTGGQIPGPRNRADITLTSHWFRKP